MKTTIKLLVMLALALATFSQHSSASAGDNLKFSGNFADAGFSMVDGCVVTNVGVFANKGKFQSPPGPGSSGAFADMYIDQYDICTGAQYILAFGGTPLSNDAFQIDRGLNSAVLNATILVFDNVSGAEISVSVNLEWVGIGPLSRGTFHSHSKSPGCVINERFSGSSRFAEATGSVSDGVTNFTPNPSGDGHLNSTKSGTLFIGCN
jgi:hypothetical protein